MMLLTALVDKPEADFHLRVIALSRWNQAVVLAQPFASHTAAMGSGCGSVS